MPRGRKRRRRAASTGEVIGGGDRPAHDGRPLELLMAVVGVDQKVLAEESGVKPKEISRIVNGEIALDSATLGSLAKALEAPPSVFATAKAFVDYADRMRASAVDRRRRVGAWPWEAGKLAEEVAEPTPEQLEWQRFDQNNRLAEELGRNLSELLLRVLERG